MIANSNICLIALGANLSSEAGLPHETVSRALTLFKDQGLSLRSVSRFYRSPAFPPGSGPDYVNGCATVQSGLSPDDVLVALHRIETMLGRERHTRWGARGIDLDLIGYGSTILPDIGFQTKWRNLPLARQMTEAPDRLILPHPRLQDRAFVLIPLAEIAPSWRHPVLGLSVREMLDRLPQGEKDALVPISAAQCEQGALALGTASA